MPRATKGAAKKAAPAKKTPAKKAAPAGRAGGAQKVQKTVAKKAVAKKVVAKKATVPAKKAAPAKKAPAATKKAVAPAKKAPPAAKPPSKPKKVVFDKFMLEQRDLLHEERARHVEQAQELRAEADQIAAEMEPGDVQFDEESGEGTTTAIDRERDLALSMQAQVEVEEIDHALAKLEAGTYGVCERCGQSIPKPRLRAIPQARLCIACKSGGLSRR
jgi:DnaK suppressor protein